MQPEKKAPSKEIARDREIEILRYLHVFGYLTAQQIAALVYSHASQKDRLARRTLQRMEGANLIIRKSGGFNAPDHHTLSEPGACLLSSLTGLNASSGKDLVREISKHRDAANWAGIKLLQEGYNIWTERDIQSVGESARNPMRSPIKNVGGKVPDLLAVDSNRLVTWVEVEASVRGGRDLKKLANWLINTAFPISGNRIPLNPPADDLWLDRVRFIMTEKHIASFPQRLERQLMSLLGPSYQSEFWTNQIEFHRVWTNESWTGFENPPL
ncbi:hypothetical protein EDC63_1244 [Sulfurirhabdus autotrophica]|uniref:Protein involved in plasmid replication-relaxation n=2 Tax=Sulfurirhabdus autotrophica TaxID=1706046 RepID=A0A4R3XSN8_9PROT|nr:hypothetical protein EDC63_1244 [Sulfurirhabdus autotrophica]